MNEENLMILAEYLETLPVDYQEFYMGDFYNTLTPEAYMRDGHFCGTAACAAGHGPAAGLLLTQEQLDHRPYGKSIWVYYIKTVFGLDWDDDECRWIFSGVWIGHDDSHYGAAARIRYLLECGVPEDFDRLYYIDQLDPLVPLYEGYLK
jgi:hypothetical protein